jgi:N-acetylmuramoyl-L-alanine amidase
VVVFFAFKTKDKNLHNTEASLAKSYVVVIDAGHGGVDNGSTSDAGIKEKELTLILAKAVKDYNNNDKLQIILSRQVDETLTPQQRIALLQQYKADLFLSVHINDVAPDTKLKSSFGGAEINVPGQSSPFLQQSSLFGSMLSENLKGFYNGKVSIKQRKQKVWVLDQNSVCPSLLVEFGYVNNEKDIALLRTEDSRKQLAEAVLKTINQYFSYNEKEVKGTAGSKTEIKNISPTNIPANEKNHVNDMVTARVTFSGSQPGVLLGDSVLVTANSISIENNKNDTSTGRRKVVSLTGNDTEKALVVLDGKEMNWKEFSGKNIDPNQIKTISVFKGESAKNKYGERGVNGVIEVLTDPKSIVTDEPVFDKVFTRVENPPFYSNGMVAFAHFIERNIQYPKEAIANNAEGAVLIQFIVDENGSSVILKN